MVSIMFGFLRTPRWIVALSVVLTIVVSFVALGNWQLRRHGELALDNDVRSSRLAEPPTDLALLLAAGGNAVDSLEYRRATVRGSFAADREVLVRNQVENGVAGFHVVTPFVFDSGTILVNRGWVPLAFDSPPVSAAPPPQGSVDIEVVLRASQERPQFGQVEPAGVLTTVNRLDLDRLSEQVEGLVPIWGQLNGQLDDEIPNELEAPSFDDDGPHLAYAIQWYLFALTAVGGVIMLIRSTGRKMARQQA